ncbi:hypothetical protein JD844_019396 [Phrynosoma platyrhinos]|uniref:BPTI/Kunitz inhibitor domain-containing protein n=1 Tax=Phrynosoma platyrhinos TaxID=52577 RepID=A0ABQ7SPU8_PHRPL|nr:hypothetical protein JD844_019396 [Phrynosoma platyrhinos]
MLRYFYNPASKSCEEFIYGGCLGNENNFQTLEQCRLTCTEERSQTVSGAPETKAKKHQPGPRIFSSASIMVTHLLLASSLPPFLPSSLQ